MKALTSWHLLECRDRSGRIGRALVRAFTGYPFPEILRSRWASSHPILFSVLRCCNTASCGLWLSGEWSWCLCCCFTYIYIRTDQVMAEPTLEILASRVQMKDKTLSLTQVDSETERGWSYYSVYLGEGSGSDCPLAETNCCEPRSVK